MMETQDKLGDLFKNALKDHREELSLQDISLLKIASDKNSFYRFNIYRFNVYYVAAMVSGLLITLALAGNYVYTISKYPTNSSSAGIGNSDTLSYTFKGVENAPIKSEPQNKILFKDTSGYHKITKSLADKNSVEKERGNENNEINRIRENKDNQTITTIENILNEISDTVKVVPFSKKERKKVFIVKRDTIIHVDTLREKAPLKRNK